MKKDITALFCFVDDFLQALDEYASTHFIEEDKRKPTRVCSLNMSEIITIILLYYQSKMSSFEHYYRLYLPMYKDEFKTLLSYSRFIELKPRALPYMQLLLSFLTKLSDKTGIAYIDATPIAVCHNKRMSKNKVFKKVAESGKTTKGWFFGLKLHLLTNQKGEIMNFQFTQGNVDDRVPVPGLTKNICGLLFGDKGYIKKELFNELYARSLKLITGIKNKMKNHLMLLYEKMLLRKRSVIESVFSIMKDHFELEHTRHRSVTNAFVDMVGVLISYCMKKSKPSIKWANVISNAMS